MLAEETGLVALFELLTIRLSSKSKIFGLLTHQITTFATTISLVASLGKEG